MMRDILRQRYSNGQWNVYGAQASDGDNWDNDSPVCSRLLAHEGVHIAAQFSGAPEHFVLRDAHGEAHLWLLPFVRPAEVRAFWPDEGVETYTDAVRTALAHAPILPPVEKEHHEDRGNAQGNQIDL